MGSGGTPKKSEAGYYDGDIPWAVIGDLNDGVVERCSTSISNAGLANSSCKLVDPGQSSLRCMDPLESSEIAGIQMATKQAIAFATPLVDQRFLFFYLMSQRSQLNSAGKGATQQNISQTLLKQWHISVPPLREQKRIVAAIEEHFARLDAVEATTVGARRRLDVLRNVIMHRAFYDDGNCQLTAEIGEIAEVSGGIQKQPKRRPRENRYPFLRVANVGRGHLDLEDVHEIELFEGEIDRFRLSKVLASCRGKRSLSQIGRAAQWGGQVEDCVHQNHLIRVRPGESLLPEYLTLCWNAPRTAQQIQAVASSTSGLYTLSTSKVKSIRIPLVPLSVQHEVVEQLDQQLGSIQMASFSSRGCMLSRPRFAPSRVGPSLLGPASCPKTPTTNQPQPCWIASLPLGSPSRLTPIGGLCRYRFMVVL